MRRLFEIGNAYARQSDWKDFALVKICLFSLGMLVALRLPLGALGKARKWARCGFVLTYVPLMKKFFRVWRNGVKR